MIYFDNVSKTYSRDNVALSGITFTVTPGEFVSIVGHSGSGKTTLARLLIAEEKPTEGQVLFESSDVHDLKESQVLSLRRRVGTIFQDFRLLFNKTAYENISFVMEAAGRSEEDIRSDVPHVLDLVNLSNKANHFPHELSGGERQRLVIARAIVNQPDVVIADEPTGNLDPSATQDIIEILKKINELDTTVLFTTHNDELVKDLRTRTLTLEEGTLVKDTGN